MRVSIVADADEFRALGPEWRALSARADNASLFNSHDWIDAWWDAFSGDSASMHVMCVRDARARLVGALPLMLEGDRFGRRRLRSIFNFYSNRSDVLVDRQAPEALEEIIAAIAGERRAWDVLEIVWLPEDSPLFLALSRGAIGDLHVHAVRTNESPYIDLRAWHSFAAYSEARFGAKKRRQDRWVLRQIERLGGSIQLIRGSEMLHALLDSVLRIEEAGWKGKLGSCMNQDVRVRAFVHDVVERAAEQGTLLLVTVSIDGAPRAFLLGVEYRGTFNFLKTSYDPSYASLGLGRVVVNRALEECFARGLERFDFLGAADEYKLRYTNDRRPHSTIFLYNSGVVSTISRAVKRHVIPLAHLVLGHRQLYPVLMDR